MRFRALGPAVFKNFEEVFSHPDSEYLFFVTIIHNGFEIFNSARLIAAGFATIALAGVGVGVGYIFGQYIFGLTLLLKKESVSIEQENKLRQIAMLGFAVTEAIGLFALMIVFLILFGI